MSLLRRLIRLIDIWLQSSEEGGAAGDAQWSIVDSLFLTEAPRTVACAGLPLYWVSGALNLHEIVHNGSEAQAGTPQFPA